MASSTMTMLFEADTETLADVGDDANLNSSWQPADGQGVTKGCIEWLHLNAAASAGGERDRGVGAQTWESLFGIVASSTVTAVQCIEWYSLSWADTNIAANGFRTRIRIVDSAGASVHSAGELVDVSEKNTPAVGTATAHGAGTSRAVDAAKQASNTTVHVEGQLSLTTVGGNPSIDYEWDTIQITITYTTGGATFTATREFTALQAVNRAAVR